VDDPGRAAIDDVIRRAQIEVPELELDAARFAAYVAERSVGAPLDRLRAGDLWIAFGCVTADPRALAMFETRFAPAIRTALLRAFDTGVAADAELRFMSQLMLVDDNGGRVAQLASYAGRGALASWLRVGAIRAALDVIRTRRELPEDPDAFGNVATAADPLLASLKQRYRDAFGDAFRGAARELTNRERAILRYRYIDDLSIDQIGVVYRVHRATVARWIASIREGLFEATRARLGTEFDLSESAVDSVLRMIDSQLDVSIETVL
jgi:RNA polymerase sigma-70 factor, ECF subfamily